MRIYFVSPVLAALKIGGIYAGILDKSEQFMDIDLSGGIFCEIIPAGGRNLAVNFIADEEFFKNPPDCVEVYHLKSCYKIAVKGFAPVQTKLEVVWQNRVGRDTLVTHFSEQGSKIMLENQNGFCYEELPEDFSVTECREVYAFGESFIEVLGNSGGKVLLIFLESSPKLVFKSKCESYQFDRELITTINFCDILKHRGRCVWEYKDGFKIKEYSVECAPDIDIDGLDQRLIPYCFFEEILAGGNAEKFLCDNLKKRAGDLKSYLGLFVDVIVPPPGIDGSGVGLIYSDGENKYHAKYFKVELSDRLITNILPLE